MSRDTITAAESLCLTADRKRVVPETDPKAAFLYCRPGHKIPSEAAAQFGIGDDGKLKGRAKVTAEKGDGEPGGGKQADKGANKQAKPGSNKGADPGSKSGAGKDAK